MSYIDIYNTDKKYQIIYADPPWDTKRENAVYELFIKK